ncbi:MAG: hypothetical protein ACKV2T_41370 [Kofleriaceae bacterium]
MTEQERIEEINSEQLATATDRVLLAARFGRARPGSPRISAQRNARHLRSPSSTQLGYSPAYHAPRGSQPHLTSNGLYVPQDDPPLYAPQAPARGSSRRIHVGASPDDHTVLTRCPAQQSAWWKFATTALVTSVLSVATAIALLV